MRATLPGAHKEGYGTTSECRHIAVRCQAPIHADAVEKGK
jgi:hypothetical protein